MRRLFVILALAVACDSGGGGGKCDDDILEEGFDEEEQCSREFLNEELALEGDEATDEDLLEIEANFEDFELESEI